MCVAACPYVALAICDCDLPPFAAQRRCFLAASQPGMPLQNAVAESSICSRCKTCQHLSAGCVVGLLYGQALIFLPIFSPASEQKLLIFGYFFDSRRCCNLFHEMSSEGRREGHTFSSLPSFALFIIFCCSGVACALFDRRYSHSS